MSSPFRSALTRTLPAIALLVGIVALSAFGQSSTATIRGKVTNESGSPLNNAEINAVNTASGFVKTVHEVIAGATHLFEEPGTLCGGQHRGGCFSRG